MGFIATVTWRMVFCLVLFISGAQAADFERRDVTFTSQGSKCAAWYYVPAGMTPEERRPAIVMAHGYSGVKESYLAEFADKFAEAGFVVLVFDYRFLGTSEGEPRQQIFWYDQVSDYLNAITWISLQPEVDRDRIGIWGSSFAGGHVMYVAAFDKRVKAVVAQVPVGDMWEAHYSSLPPDVIGRISARNARARELRLTVGEVEYWPVVAPEGQRCALRHPEAFRWFTEMGRHAPSWKNRVTVESFEANMFYNPVAHIDLISPIPLLMVIGSDDTLTPTEQQKRAFERAGEPKKLVVVQGARHFDAYNGPRHLEFFAPQLEWFWKHLAKR